MIAASNVDLAKAVEEERFRLDRYHRLADIQIDVPPFRERHDVLILAERYRTGNVSRRGRSDHKTLPSTQHHWG